MQTPGTGHSSIYGRGGAHLHNAPRLRPTAFGAALLAPLLMMMASAPAPARGPLGARDADLQMAVTQAHKRYAADRSGKIPEDVPALTRISPDLYGVVIVRVDGKIYEAGDTRIPLVMAAVATPFTAALVAEQQGTDVLAHKVGVAAGPPTGAATQPVAAGEGTNNPLDWEGSISTLSLVQPQKDVDAKWRAILGNFGAFAGRELTLDDGMYRSATATRAAVLDAAKLLASQGRLYDDTDATADLYVKSGAVTLTARDLAIMAATLANGGINPVSGSTVVKQDVSQNIQALVTGAGLRSGTGKWMYKIGIPAVAGRSGGIIAIVPGRMGIATYSPPLDAAGISVRGQRAIKYIGQALQISLYPNWQ